MAASPSWPSTHMTLIERIASAEDAEAWEFFHKIYSPLILQFCQRRRLQAADAADVCQNVIQSMRQTLPHYAAEKGRFRCWFSQVIRRQIAAHLEVLSRRPGSLEHIGEPCCEADDASDEDQIRRYVLNMALEAIRPELTSQEWHIMSEVVLKGRKPREVGEEIGMEAPRISRVKYQLIRRLKEKIRFLENCDISEWQFRGSMSVPMGSSDV
jgi:RNA polymerase sigma factor (sigma-70 family)